MRVMALICSIRCHGRPSTRVSNCGRVNVIGVPEGSAPMTLTQPQFDALVLGLPWQRLEQMRVITRM